MNLENGLAVYSGSIAHLAVVKGLVIVAAILSLIYMVYLPNSLIWLFARPFL